MNDILIFGKGAIGKFTESLLEKNPKKNVNVDFYDPKHNLTRIQKDYSLVFICVPTYSDENSLRHVKDCLNLCRSINKELVIIRSTLPIGSMKEISKEYNFEIVYMPEFLTENILNSRVVPDDYKTIVTSKDSKQDDLVCKFFLEKFKISSEIIEYPEEAEAIKILLNFSLALKVINGNIIYEICENNDLDYKRVVNNILHKSNKRLSSYGFEVPGKDGYRGFNGKCLEKDITSLIGNEDLIGHDIDDFIREMLVLNDFFQRKGINK